MGSLALDAEVCTPLGDQEAPISLGCAAVPAIIIDGDGSQPLVVPDASKGGQKAQTTEVVLGIDGTIVGRRVRAKGKMPFDDYKKMCLSKKAKKAKKAPKAKGGARKAASVDKKDKKKAVMIKKRDLLRATIEPPIKIVRRTATPKRPGETYIMCGHNKYVCGATSKATAKYNEVVDELVRCINSKVVTTRLEARVKLRALVRTMGKGEVEWVSHGADVVRVQVVVCVSLYVTASYVYVPSIGASRAEGVRQL